jgi:DNA-binding MarR family transcriptional regulator
VETALENKLDRHPGRPLSTLDGAVGREPDFALIELMFFAYRDYLAEGDRLLESFGLGRAHYRILHFVNRRPGLTIAELLGILKITKQSLSPVLKELLDQNYVVARRGETDRRQRRLFLTEQGEVLPSKWRACIRSASSAFLRNFRMARAPRSGNFSSPWLIRLSG